MAFYNAPFDAQTVNERYAITYAIYAMNADWSGLLESRVKANTSFRTAISTLADSEMAKLMVMALYTLSMVGNWMQNGQKEWH